tara:strand:+ start:507 stop:677 length:171 start_codon:yes stop_codon:yes gene_type:complete
MEPTIKTASLYETRIKHIDEYFKNFIKNESMEQIKHILKDVTLKISDEEKLTSEDK